MSLTADKKLEYTEGVEHAFDVYRSTTIFGGSLVCVRADGYAVPGSDASGLIFEGVATEKVINSGNDGDAKVVLRRRGLFNVKLGHTVTIANIGDNVFLVDDETVDLAAQTTYNIFCGIIAGIIDSTHAWIDIEPAIKQADLAAHIADTSGAHAASAIDMTDAGDHFSAAEASVEHALQKLAKTIPLNFALATITSAASDQKVVENFELPVAVRIKRAYATLGTAPGESKTLTIEIKVASGADATLVAVAGTATNAEDEALDIAIPANTDFDILLTQDTGAAADLNLMLIAQIDDGE
jgi:hypothetical protein